MARIVQLRTFGSPCDGIPCDGTGYATQYTQRTIRRPNGEYVVRLLIGRNTLFTRVIEPGKTQCKKVEKAQQDFAYYIAQHS